MEVESVMVEDERRLTRLRFDAAVKVIKSLPPDGERPHQSAASLTRALTQGSNRPVSDSATAWSGLDPVRFKRLNPLY